MASIQPRKNLSKFEIPVYRYTGTGTAGTGTSYPKSITQGMSKFLSSQRSIKYRPPLDAAITQCGWKASISRLIVATCRESS